MKRCLPQEFKIVQGTLGPVTTNGGVTGDYVSLKNAHRCTVVIHLDQAVGHATAITIEQATAVAGTSTKAITTSVPIWQNADAAASDTLVRATDAVGLTVAADVKTKIAVFQLDPATLDDANNFDCITCKLANSAQAANFASILYFLETRFAQATPPSAIVD